MQTLLFVTALLTMLTGGPLIDGVLGEGEWTGARHETMEQGGEVWLRRDGDRLFVAIKAAKNGIASLCTGNQKEVEILHASAALGTARFVREGNDWKAAQDFTWTVRENATAAQRQQHLESAGWLANSHRHPHPIREFEVRLRPGRELLGLTFLHTDEPHSVAYWPKTIDDDCRAIALGQGYVAAGKRFQPGGWAKTGI